MAADTQPALRLSPAGFDRGRPDSHDLASWDESNLPQLYRRPGTVVNESWRIFSKNLYRRGGGARVASRLAVGDENR
jgi:hypothetical protein